MQLTTITVQELKTYISSKAYQTSPVIPITPQRAISHINNPKAKADDLILSLIHNDKNELVAYLGVLPDELHFSTVVERCCWLSCMWVNPITRGQGLARRLLASVFEAWDNRVLVTEFTPAAKRLYDKSGHFIDLAKPKGFRAYLRLNLHYLLPKKNEEKWTKWKWALNILDGGFNFFNKIRLALFSTPQVELNYIAEPDEEVIQLINACQKNGLMNRQSQDLTWMLRYPWVLSSKVKDENAKRYYFSSVDKRFQFLPTKVYQNKKLVGFLIFAIRGNNLKIPYAYFQEEHVSTVLQAIYQQMLTEKLDMLTCFHPLLLKHIKTSKHPFFKVRDFQRHYIISKRFAEPLEQTPNFSIQDGDADAAFT
ncbi:MAG: GNAT family N-acetyltransferase [Saprospiraceae bacterium]|nr:GNAT family N-acetyltransferase [Saprospiraceae bacterium]